MAAALAATLIDIVGCGAPPASYYDEANNLWIETEVLASTFPEEWQSSPINAGADSLPAGQRSRAMDILKREIAKYPPTFLSGKVARIWILSRLTFYNSSYGGTSFSPTKSLYLAFHEPIPSTFLAQSFHQELSSLLLFEHKPTMFQGSSWASLAGNDWQWSEAGIQALKRGAGIEFDRRLHEKGFLYEYASSAPEEDFNSFAANLFCPDPAFWRAVDEFPLLKRKMKLTVAYYASMDTSFSEEFFRRIAARDAD